MSQIVSQHSQSPIHFPHTSSRQSVEDRIPFSSLHQSQRTTTFDTHETPMTQIIKSHLELQNFELMMNLQQKNQEQMRDYRLVFSHFYNILWTPAQAVSPPPALTSPHVVLITLMFPLLPVVKAKEPAITTTLSDD